MTTSRITIRTFCEGRVTAVEACSDRTFSRHTHEEYGIGLITAGAQRSWSGRGTVEAAVGGIITVNPGEAHDGAPIGEMRAWNMLYLAPELVAEYVLDITEGSTAAFEFSLPAFNNRATAQRFAKANAAMRKPASRAAEMSADLITLLAGVLEPGSASLRGSPPGIRLAKASIDDDPVGNHSLEALARTSGLSKFQTIRGFARSTGLTPHAYVVQRRLDFARRLIREHAMLADVACAAGFADQSHLNRAFRQRYGLTPGCYAAALR